MLRLGERRRYVSRLPGTLSPALAANLAGFGSFFFFTAIAEVNRGGQEIDHCRNQEYPIFQCLHPLRKLFFNFLKIIYHNLKNNARIIFDILKIFFYY